jgi:hypothetical protein
MSAAARVLGRPLAAVLTGVCAIMLLTCPHACAAYDNLNLAAGTPSGAPARSSEAAHGCGLHLALLASDSFLDLSSSVDYSSADFDWPQPNVDSDHEFISFSARFAGPTILSKLHRLLFRMADIPPPHLVV